MTRRMPGQIQHGVNTNDIPPRSSLPTLGLVHHPQTHRRRHAAEGLIRSAGVVLVIALTVSLAACGARRDPTVAPTLSAPADSGVTTRTDMVYREIDGQTLEMDACLPADGTAPTAAVILLHGGGFTQGSRSDESMTNLCVWLATNGYAAFPISYRFAPDYIFPSQTEDVAAAVEWLRDPEQVADFNIDPERIGALGSSAGAILTLEAATSGEGPTTVGSRLKAVVSLSGVADMTSGAVALGTPSAEAVTIILNYLGCTSLADCDGSAASPVTHVDSSDPPALLVGAEQDLVPIQQAQRMAASLDSVGVANEVIVVPGAGHGAQLMNQDVRDQTLAFLAENL
ncbi:alpha/beta hydrolase [Microbacterium sp. NPDC064584]|uniref:alpha/beta hydrolase n=1 Tax=Microbacterium sp. NPDC064584 TaxID=3155817 RepID=UPI003428AB32